MRPAIPGQPPRTILVGLTGPIGCGKSTVAGWLAERGAVVVDADAVAREVVEPGEPALAAVAQAFGPGVIRPDGALDRAALARVVFADPQARRCLEDIIRPAVRPRIWAHIDAARAAGATAVVLEAIGLVEGGYAPECDEVWLVSCPPQVQRERLRGRGADDEDSERRIAAQEPALAGMRAAATRVLDTSGPREAVRARVAEALQEALAQA